MHEGLILKGIGGFYYVKSNSEIFECKPRGIFRKEKVVPIVGDRVNFSIVNEALKEGVIEKIFPRKSLLIRPPVANVDQVILTFAVKSPDPDLLLLDKMIIKSISLDIRPIICINKIDLDTEQSLINMFRYYSKAGLVVIYVSASEGFGIENLMSLIGGKLSILAGPSGVGKSTIVKKLYPDERVLIGSLSDKIERGKHTTRHVELFEVEEGGFLADTPGFSSFSIDEIASISLGDYYPEFRDYYKNCRFAGCSHISEPSCAVKSAVENQCIDSGRYERYKKLYKQLKEKERYKI